MSVNGSGIDKKTKKPAQDPTSWSVKHPGTGELARDQKGNVMTGLNATDAFAAVRSARRVGVTLATVRT